MTPISGLRHRAYFLVSFRSLALLQKVTIASSVFSVRSHLFLVRPPPRSAALRWCGESFSRSTEPVRHLDIRTKGRTNLNKDDECRFTQLQRVRQRFLSLEVGSLSSCSSSYLGGSAWRRGAKYNLDPVDAARCGCRCLRSSSTNTYRLQTAGRIDGPTEGLTLGQAHSI